MTEYTPRRASQRWLKGAPDYVLDVLDNKGKTCDRYTVIFGKKFMNEFQGTYYLQYLAMSGEPTHPQGFSQWGEFTRFECQAYRYRCKHQRIRWEDLPENVRQHVIDRAEEE